MTRNARHEIQLTRADLHAVAHAITAAPSEGRIITGVAAGLEVAWTAQQWAEYQKGVNRARTQKRRAGKVAA